MRPKIGTAVLWMCAGLIAPSFSQSLVISEVHYHPLTGEFPAGTTNLLDGDEFEFLEIRNTGSATNDLDGYSVSGGISFTFSGPYALAPGESVVIVENSPAFAVRYPWVTAVAGQYGGKLSNGGESLVLEDAFGVPVFSVTYDDGNGWPTEPDGDGRSLMLANPAGDPNDPANWCASAELHGSPGVAGSCLFTDVVINEVLSHSDPPLEDAIELFNTSGSPVDLTGWYLSDDLIQPRKYRITNSVISAEGYAVFYEYQFNGTPPADTNNIPFALSSLGDELILTAPIPESQSLRLVDAIDFEATVTDVSFGRFPNGSGDFISLASLTFGTVDPATVEIFRTGTGAANSGPRAQTVVINEIMYHPRQDDEEALEYIELYNAGDVAYDMSGWVLDGVNFTNPPGTVIAPGEYLVVCANETEFFNAYGIVNTLGNWPGVLQNGGERIDLRTDEGALIDSVRYNDKEPWPAGADGYGPSLERIRADAEGDSYMNWQASRNGTGWETVTFTQTVAAVTNTSLKVWLDYEGKCYLDNVSVQPLGGGSELLANGDFELGSTNWSFNGNHAWSRTVATAGEGGTVGLGMVGNFTRLLFSDPVIPTYGREDGDNIESDSFHVTKGDYVVSFQVLRSGPAQNVYISIGGAVQSYRLGNYGTPGAANSTASPLAVLGIAEMAPDSAVVSTGVANTIRAQLEGNYAGAAVSLNVRMVGPGEYQFTDVETVQVPMADDGTAPDRIAGDGEYAATVPAETTNWTIVRYHVSAVGTNGFSARYPTIDNPSGDRAYWVQSDAVQTTLPNWHVVSDGSPIVYSNSFRCCAVSPSGEVFTDVRVRHRGAPVPDEPEAQGVALRVNRDQPYDAFFGDNQSGINFRSRSNVHSYLYNRFVNEYIAYHLQRTVGLATPHLRHICLWMNGEPFITTELEAPDSGFLDLQDLSEDDYISRAGWSGRRTIDGDEELDNFWSIYQELIGTSVVVRTASVRTNVWVESVRTSMALQSVLSSFDQGVMYNMFQHRLAINGRWTQYQWDVDKTFMSDVINGRDIVQLHPYYTTPDYPYIYDENSAGPLGLALFYPEDSLLTLPYRYRQQMSLWRYCHTLFTTNYINPFLDQLQADLEPAFAEIGVDDTRLLNKIASVKDFITARRDFLMNGSWSDKDTNIWAVADYDPATLVINEIMYDPDVGNEYLGVYNSGSNTLDMSWWLLRVGPESYHLPHGTMLAPGSELVIADSFSVLTNTYPELRSSSEMAQRSPGLPIWDWPIEFYTNTEYSTRVVDIPSLTLPNDGAVIEMFDLCSNLVDTVTYSDAAPWPVTQGAALELVDSSLDNALPSSWRSSFIDGTPATQNTAGSDWDDDGLIDSWEGLINGDISLVLPGGDEDGDQLSNEREFVLGTDPKTNDAHMASLEIFADGSVVLVGFQPIAVSGTGYEFYHRRLYTLEQVPALPLGSWTNVAEVVEVPGDGAAIVYTNALPAEQMFYRYNVQLERRPPQ